MTRWFVRMKNGNPSIVRLLIWLRRKFLYRFVCVSRIRGLYDPNTESLCPVSWEFPRFFWYYIDRHIRVGKLRRKVKVYVEFGWGLFKNRILFEGYSLGYVVVIGWFTITVLLSNDGFIEILPSTSTSSHRKSASSQSLSALKANIFYCSGKRTGCLVWSRVSSSLLLLL